MGHTGSLQLPVQLLALSIRGYTMRTYGSCTPYTCVNVSKSMFKFFPFCLFSASEIEDENIVMYVGLIVAIFVFITVVIIIIILLRRKTQQNGVYDYCKPYTYTGIIHSSHQTVQTIVEKIYLVQHHLVEKCKLCYVPPGGQLLNFSTSC